MTANILETKAAKTEDKNVGGGGESTIASDLLKQERRSKDALWNLNHPISWLTRQPTKTAYTDEMAREWPA